MEGTSELEGFDDDFFRSEFSEIFDSENEEDVNEMSGILELPNEDDHTDLLHGNNEMSIFIIGDSWTTEKRTNSDRIKDKTNLFIRPHHVKFRVANDGMYRADQTFEFVFLKNLSREGLTFQKALNDQRALTRWAVDVPALTIVHLGGCDIANTDIGRGNVRKNFKDAVDNFLTQWPILAKEHTQNICEFNRRIKKHKWMLCNVPDLGANSEIENISAREYKVARSYAHACLKRNQKRWFESHKVFICFPAMSNPERRNIHLAPVSQAGFIEQLFKAVSKIICESCQTSDTYDKQWHMDLLKDTPCKRNTHGQSSSSKKALILHLM
ncbi:unnamed protein product [Meganyctiphanes norvegica]|uniref:Uncharacterized protein n=1 Tax=Meganyctiphanes norvegica TaxID=48144 RepID=A0AAV2SGP9_MEGNR